MFTDSQMETYDQIRNRTMPGAADFIPEDADWQPPRVSFPEDFPALMELGPDFTDAPILLVGYANEDLAECECDNSHVTYAPIRSDGLIGPILTSNTYGEAQTTSGIDPIMMLMGMVDPDNLPEPQYPTWDAAREVTPDEWPIGESAQPTITDMADYERLLADDDRL